MARSQNKKDKVEKNPAVHQTAPISSEEVQLAGDTLLGDMRDSVLAVFKQLAEPWHRLSEDEQHKTADYIETEMERIIRKACDLVAAPGRETIIATISGVAAKDADIVAKIKVRKTPETWNALGMADGYPVSLILNQADAHMDERAPAAIDKDQGSLLEEEEEAEEE